MPVRLLVAVLTAAGLLAAPVPYCGEESFEGAIGVSAERMRSRKVVGDEPDFPPLARAARIHGTVVVTVLVNEAGRVACLSVVNGHPLLLPAVASALAQWVFRPMRARRGPMRYYGELSFAFSSTGPARPRGRVTRVNLRRP